MDSNLKENFSEVEVLKCIHIGLLCIQENPNVRPTMSTVISYLNNPSVELSSPQDPIFFMRNMDHEIIPQQGSSSGQDDNGYKQLSINEMSVSNFYPR